MSVRHRGSFSGIQRDIDRCMQRGIRDLTRETKVQVRARTPKRTGLLARNWQMRVKGWVGIVSNRTRYVRVVALGRRDRPLSPKERANVNFHIRGVQDALAKADSIFRRAFGRGL